MAQVIKVTPDKDGRLFIRLYGSDLEIVVEEKTPTKKSAKKSTDAAE